MHMEKQRIKKYLVFFIIIIFIAVIIFVLFNQGVLWFNNPLQSQYPVRGVDVSAHQGEIDWDALASQGIDFAFIKATEGSSFVDKNFKTNWENARSAGIITGAYHFFSFESPAQSQAENFINTVPCGMENLPPVVDIEFYGEFSKQHPAPEEVRAVLEELLNLLYEHYHVRPIIYATLSSYEMYIANHYEDYPIWIRSVYFEPVLSDNREWLFWQYSHKGRLYGYSGRERFIDLNVFNGSRERFEELFLK